MNRIKISENFSLHEFECKGNKEVKIDEKLINKLQKMRDIIGKPITITSGYRTKAYNFKLWLKDKKGVSLNSQHMKGTAADIEVDGMDPKEVFKIAEQVGFDGIKAYKTFTHVDVRGYKARW